MKDIESAEMAPVIDINSRRIEIIHDPGIHLNRLSPKELLMSEHECA